jgi:anti-sigma B factor antagonist
MVQAEQAAAPPLLPLGSTPRHAILIACWNTTDPQLQALSIDSASTPLMARPLVQRAVEQLANLGCVRLTVITGTQSAACQRLLGDGERFGVTLDYVNAQDSDHYQTKLVGTLGITEERVWIASATTVPDSDTLLELMTRPESLRNRIVVSKNDSKNRWLGWGILDPKLALTLILKSQSGSDLEQAILDEPTLQRVQCIDALTLESGASALQSLMYLMKRGHPAGVIAKRMHSPGVWIAGDSTIDPEATLNPPIYIGHQVRIDAGATVGPGVVIEAGSIIEAGVFIRNAWILPHTYVGHQTTLINVIVSGNSVLSLDHQVLIKVTDPFLLDGDMTTRTATQGPGLVERLTAVMLWLILAPLVYWWRRRLQMKQTPTVAGAYNVAFPDRMTYGFKTQLTALKPEINLAQDRLPRALAFHFFNTFYPGLIDIWCSRVKFIGLKPRNMDEIVHLTQTEQSRYAHWPIGLINQSTLNGQESKEIPTRQGMPLRRSVQLVLGYGQQVHRSVAQAVLSQYSATSPTDTEPRLTQLSRTEDLMKLSQTKPGIAVVLLSSESLDIKNVKNFRARIKPIIEQNHTILLDMHKLTFIDSAGLAALLYCLRAMTKKHATLRLFGMCQTVHALFELVRMSRVFKIYSTDVEALKNLPEG